MTTLMTFNVNIINTTYKLNQLVASLPKFYSKCLKTQSNSDKETHEENRFTGKQS